MSDLTNLAKFGLRIVTLSDKSGPTPLSVFLDPAVPCNLSCVMCSRTENDYESEFKRSYYSLESFKRLVNITRPRALTFTPTGETTMNKDLPEMVKHASENGIYTTLATNGTFLGKKELDRKLLKAGLDYLRVSIDGVTRAPYKAVRGADALELISRNVKRFVELKKTLGANRTHIRIDFTVHGGNVHEMKLLPAFAKRIGVRHIDYRILSMVMFSVEKQSRLLKNIQNKVIMKSAFESSEKEVKKNKVSSNLPVFKKQHMETYCSNKTAKTSSKSTLKPVCLLPWLQLYSTVDGDLMPCGFMAQNKSKYGHIGNIECKDAESIWNSDKMQNMRKEFRQRKNFQLSECCKECTIPYTLPMLIKLALKTKDLSRLLGFSKFLRFPSFLTKPL